MLTILVRHRESGIETIYQAESVDFVPAVPESDTSHDEIILNGENLGRIIGHLPEDPRIVFVMNEAGQTVARYNL